MGSPIVRFGISDGEGKEEERQSFDYQVNLVDKIV
jgi:hypothetical protein